MILTDELHRVVVPNYFKDHAHPQLVAPNGAQLPSHVVDALTGHTAYAQAGAPSAAAKVVGHIVKISGSASIVRNGVTIVANVGDAVNQSDVVQTGSGSTLGLALDDGTTFNLSESSRFQLNELTYDANSTSNSSLMTLVQGAASFVAGQVARTGDMKVATPTATLGIRGTAVNLSVSSTDGTVSVSVVDQRDGQVHAVQVFANNGTLIGTVTSNGASLTLTPTATFDVIAQQTDKTAAQVAQEFNAFQQVLSTYDAAKQIMPNLPQHTDNTNQPNNNDSNTKSTTKFASSAPLDPPGTEYHPPAATTTTQSASAPPPTTVSLSSVSTPATAPTTTTSLASTPTILAVKTTSLPFIVTPSPVAMISSGAGDHTGPVMSASGDLVYDPDGVIYYYDHTTGATTTIASPAGGWTYGQPTISLDGRYIVYQGSNGSGTYVFVYGTDPSDATHYHVQTQLGAGSAPAVSGDGSTIVAQQGAGNIAIYDLQGNLKGTITAATVNSGGAVWKPAISADGHIIAFWNSDSNSPGGSGHLYTYNLATGDLTQIASTASGAGQTAPTVSADGHLIAYQSTDSSGHSEIYLYDLDAGTVVFHTANASGSSYSPALSPDGHFIAFTSDAQLTSSDQNNSADIYIVDVTNPAAPVYKLVSEGSTSASYNGVAISAGGQYVAFGDSTSIFFADPTSGRAAVIVETSQSPAILTTSGQITVTGDYSGVVLGVSDQFGQPTSNFSAAFDASGHINWTFSEAKSDFSVLSYGQDATQEFIITLSANDGTVTIPVFVTVHDGVQPTISATDFAPIARPVSLSEGQQNTAYTITAADLLNGVVDIDGPSLSISALSLQSGGGSLSQIDSQTWTYTPAAGFSGQVVFNYTTTDSIKSASSTASLNIALPLAITAIAPDTGVAGDFITSNTNLTVSGTNGTLTSGEKIQISSDNGVTWADVVQSSATGWSFTDPLTHAASFTYEVRVVDSNDTAINATSQAVVIDTAPPVLTIANASGFTNQISLTLTGTLDLADVGTPVTVFDDGQSIGTATVQADGSWTKVVSLHAGANNLSSQATDVAGNIGTSNTIVVTLDTTAPSEALAIAAISLDTGTPGDFVTSDTILTVSGTNGALASDEKIQISSNGGATWVDVTQSTATTWSYADPATHNVSFTYQVRIVDLAGNIGTTASQAITIDTTAPTEALAITAISADTGIPGDFITSDTTLTVSGTNGALSAGEKIQVSSDGGATWADVTQSTSTSWSYVDPTTHSISFTYQARIVDLAGNIGTGASQAITIDTTAPTILISNAGGPTNQANQTITGLVDIADAGATVTVYDGGTAVASALVQSNGSWSTSVTLSTGTNSLTAKVSDLAGNTTTSNTVVYTLNTSVPVLTEHLTSDTGSSATDQNTSNPALTGTGLASTVVHFTVDGTPIATTVLADASGNWSFAPSGLADGSHTIVASQTDAFGNTGSASLTFTLDTTAPAETLAITAISPDTGTVGDFITSATTLTVSGTNGTLAAGEKIQVSSNGGGTWADVTQSTSTTWTYADPVTHASSFIYQTRIIDLAGNIGTTASRSITIDTTAPAEALAITAISTDTGTPGDFITSDTTLTVSGTNGALAAGEKIQVSNNGGSTWFDVTQSTSTTWTYTDPVTHASSFTYQARIIDLAGNIGTTASQAITIDTTAPAEALAITAISPDTGTPGDFVTNATALTVSGTNGVLSAGEKVQVSSDSGLTWVDATQSTSTTWSYVDPVTHNASFTYQARLIDAAGNIGTTTSHAVTIDTSAPTETLAIGSIAASSSPTSAAITVSGTNSVLQAGDKVQISTDGTTWTDVTRVSLTRWSFLDAALHTTGFTYFTRVVDFVGNVGSTANLPVVVANNSGTASISGSSTIIAEVTGSGGTLQIGAAGATATINAISVANGPVTINGAGIVNTAAGDAIDLYATAATSANPANLTINPTGAVTGAANGISALQNAYGSVTVTANAAVTGLSGRGIYVQQSTTGAGGILVNGAGDVTGTGAAYSGIVAAILNVSNNNDVTVNESGNITGGYDGIRVITHGNGNEFVTTGTNATISGLTRYGIEAQSIGTGNIKITTGTSGTVTSASAAINAYNQASAIPSGVSSITVTSNGTIKSGTALTGSGNLPAGVLAGYKGGINNTVNANVYGNVTIDNYANITAAYGDGVRGYNFGSGNVTINDHAGTINAKDEYGISASSYGSGNVQVTMDAAAIIVAGSHGITAINQATAIAASAASTVSVTAAGTITSGVHLTGGGSQPQGISAGYYGSNGTVNTNINGSVTLDNSANVTALAGWGLLAYNWGNGSVTLTDRAGTTVWGAQYGVQAASNVSGASAAPSTVTLTVEANAVITAGALYGLVGVQATNTSGGSILVTTNSGDQITSGGTGINANAAPSSALAGTQVSVTAAGTIKSGYDFFSNANGPSGIAAGFSTSNGSVNSAIHGDVVVNTSATITAAAGWGLNLYNFGTGNVSGTVQSGSVIKAPVVGINAFAQGGGSVTITNNGSVIATGTGINVGTGTSGSSVSGTLSVTNTGSVAGSGLVFNQVVQINSTNSNQPATFTNSGTVAANMFAKSTNSYALAMYTTNGTVTVNNNSGGTLTGNVQLGGTAGFSNKTGATWNLNGQSSIGSVAGTLTNAGIINMLGFAVLASGGSLAFANNGTVNVGAYSAAKISGDVSGSGTIAMGDRSSLEMSGAVTGQTVDFAYNRGLLTIDLPASYNASNTIDHLAIGDVIALAGAGISGASLGSSAISVTGASQNYTLNVANVQSGAMMDILAADKLILVSSAPSDPLFHTGQFSSSTPSLNYILNNDTITGAGYGFVINATDASAANTYTIVVNQNSSINVTGAGAGVAASTTGANIAVVNAATVSSGGTGISTSSAAGNTDITDFGAVTGAKYAIAAAATTGKLNVLIGSGVALTSTTSYGLYAQTTSGDINITTISSPTSASTINSGSAGILAQEQGIAGATGSITILNQSTITSGSNGIGSGDATIGPANGSAGIRAGILNNGGTAFSGSTTTGNVYVEDRGNITAATGSGIFAFNYGAGNTTVSLGQSAQIQATAAGTTTSGFTQYGIYAFNYGAGSTTVTTGWGSKIQSGGTGINAGDQATAIAQGAGSTLTVIAEGVINSGANNNNSGSAPAGILAGYNPGNAGVYNANVYGDVFVGVSGDGNTNGIITAAAGSGINAFNYGIGSVTVTLGAQVSIQALTAATSSSGNAPYGIGTFILGAGNITVTTGSGDNIQSGSTGINAVNEASSIAAAVGATIAVTTGGTIHSRTLVNNGGNQPSGISAGFLGGLTQTVNLNVNGTVIVNNAAVITADAGIGINAYNFGNGNITVNVANGANISAVAQAIDAHSEGAGTGDIAVNVYANTQLTSSTTYGVLALNTNNGSISVITSTGDVINAAGAGINAVNEASATSASTSVVVTAAGAINSGTALTGFGGQPAGILAGYVGQATNPGSTNPANYNVHGDVVVGNFATIIAAAGNGIQAYTYGTGDVYVNNFGASITALGGVNPPNGSGLGILAQSYGPGSIFVSTTGTTLINSGGSGIAALNKATTVDPANPTTVVPATSVVSVIANGTINSGTIPTANAAGDPAAGILAGYNPNNLSTANNQVFGSVFIDDHATIVAPTGTDGIRGVNYGTGDISIIVESDADIIAGRYGVAALGYDGGDVSIVLAGSVFGGTAGLDAITTGTGTAIIDITGFVNGVIMGYNATVTNEAGADWQFSGTSTFTGASTFSNAGTIESTGVSSIQGLAGFTNTGAIAVETGSLTIGTSVTGGGAAIIHNATLTLGAASDMIVSFDTGPTTPGVLVLADPAHFTGTVTGFAYGDTIDLAGIAPANVSVSNSGGLTVNYGTGMFALVGNYDPAGFSIASDGHGGTNIVWNHQAPVTVTSQLSTVHNNADGSTTITGLLVTDSDPNAGSETFSITATTAGASSGSSVSVSTSSGSLSSINGILASGVTYVPGATPPATDMVSLTVKDGFGATETVNFIFNQAGTGPNITLQGTAGNDVIFATNSSDILTGGTGQDQFLFAPASALPITHTVTDFTLGIDKLDVRLFSGISASSLPTEAQVGNDTLVTLDANDSILLKNVVATNLHATDFIFHA